MGERGQPYINAAWDNIQEHVKLFPELKEKAPVRKYLCEDNGCMGYQRSILAMLATWK
jgi:hypothetical protein